MGAKSVAKRGVFNRRYEPLLYDVGTIPFPAEGREQASLDALDAACQSADKPAAFIAEPLILRAGGKLIYPAWVVTEMAAACRRHGVPWIVDEALTGWGRLGPLFSC